MKERIFTKKPMISSSLRLRTDELDLIRAAATRRAISVSQLLREAAKEKSEEILQSK
jgi:uncharacterized protein (DUF1778 family)